MKTHTISHWQHLLYMLPHGPCNSVKRSIKTTEVVLFTILLKNTTPTEQNKTPVWSKSSKKSSVEHIYTRPCKYLRAKSGETEWGSNWHERAGAQTQVLKYVCIHTKNILWKYREEEHNKFGIVCSARQRNICCSPVWLAGRDSISFLRGHTGWLSGYSLLHLWYLLHRDPAPQLLDPSFQPTSSWSQKGQGKRELILSTETSQITHTFWVTNKERHDLSGLLCVCTTSEASTHCTALILVLQAITAPALITLQPLVSFYQGFCKWAYRSPERNPKSKGNPHTDNLEAQQQGPAKEVLGASEVWPDWEQYIMSTSFPGTQMCTGASEWQGDRWFLWDPDLSGKYLHLN